MRQAYKDKLKKAGIILFWLLVWGLLAVLVNNKFLLVSPVATIRRGIQLLTEGSFYLTVIASFGRICLGFAAGLAAAIGLAVLSARYKLVEDLLAPVMKLMTAVPVASFVVLLLIWWGSSFLAVAICFIIVLPTIYLSTLEGIKSTDKSLLEMAKVFRLPKKSTFLYIYRPALKPFLSSSLKLALGMCWKSGVAAEVIGTPDHSIGEQLYMSKIYLDTAGVFAWTAVVILLSVVFEKIVLHLTERFFAWQPACEKAGCNTTLAPGTITLQSLSKSYGDQKILDSLDCTYEAGGTYYLREPSGSGKTTLLRLLSGLEKADSGVIKAPANCSYVFQEDRLCEDYSALKNVEMVTGNKARAREALEQILEGEALHKPCSQLSGGMRRRVAIVRAMEAESDMVLLDEPFTGLDAETREKCEKYIAEKQGGRTLIIATHI